jgi:hypothetical protein
LAADSADCADEGEPQISGNAPIQHAIVERLAAGREAASVIR